MNNSKIKGEITELKVLGILLSNISNEEIILLINYNSQN